MNDMAPVAIFNGQVTGSFPERLPLEAEHCRAFAAQQPKMASLVTAVEQRLGQFESLLADIRQPGTSRLMVILQVHISPFPDQPTNRATKASMRQVQQRIFEFLKLRQPTLLGVEGHIDGRITLEVMRRELIKQFGGKLKARAYHRRIETFLHDLALDDAGLRYAFRQPAAMVIGTEDSDLVDLCDLIIKEYARQSAETSPWQRFDFEIRLQFLRSVIAVSRIMTAARQQQTDGWLIIGARHRPEIAGLMESGGIAGEIYDFAGRAAVDEPTP